MYLRTKTYFLNCPIRISIYYFGDLLTAVFITVARDEMENTYLFMCVNKQVPLSVRWTFVEGY